MNLHSQPLIRKALPGEEAELHEAHMRSIREVCSRDHTAEEISGWGHRPLGNRWTAAIERDQILVAEIDGQVLGVGHLGVLPNNPEEGHIYALYLTPETTRMGVGAEMVNQLLDYARSKGVKVVRLYSTITAHKFYQRLGFVDEGEMQTMMIGGNPVRCYPMVLKLS